MNVQEAHQYLSTFINYEVKPPENKRQNYKLDRVRKVLEFLGDPQKQLKVIHVAGSKGKGSTCAMIAQILHAEGYTVGLFTSPHLNSYRERIRLLGKTAPPQEGDVFDDTLTDDELAEHLGDIKPAVDKYYDECSELGRISFFEIFTILAFHYFRKTNADVVVLETGLGGRLDATNVCESKVAVITHIGLEHTGILGDSLVEIAKEKAAIIKAPGQKVIVAEQMESVLEVINWQCSQYEIKPQVVGVDIVYEHLESRPEGQLINLVIGERHCDNIFLGLRGRHQVINAAQAVGAILALASEGIEVNPKAIEEGLKKVFWPGRFEIIQEENPPILLDCAHTKASISDVAESFQQRFPGKDMLLVFGASADKNIKDMFQELEPYVRVYMLTKAKHPRSHVFSELEAIQLLPHKDVRIIESVEKALDHALKEYMPNDVIVITGSVFTVSDARRYLLEFVS